MLLTSLIFVELVELCAPFMGNDPPQFSGVGVIAALQPVR